MLRIEVESLILDSSVVGEVWNLSEGVLPSRVVPVERGCRSCTVGAYCNVEMDERPWRLKLIMF